MNFYLKVLSIAILIIAPNIVRAEFNPIERLLFSNRNYAKEVEIKAYIITEEQACNVFCHPQEELVQLNNKELYAKTTYLFLRLINKGKENLWGTLACKVPRYHKPIKLSVSDADRPREYKQYLLELGVISIVLGDVSVPNIKIEWDELYTK